MKPLLLAKLAMFEKKKNAKPIIEKNLLMWICKRRYQVAIAEERKRLAELRRIEEVLGHHDLSAVSDTIRSVCVGTVFNHFAP
jgi:hypothetical protein